MRRTRLRSTALRLALALSGGVAGCAKHPTAPATGPGAPVLAVVSGSGQTGPARGELPQPLVVRATDALGRALPGIAVVFVVTQGGGAVHAAGVLTSTSGVAQNYWTLGAAGPQAVEVRSVDAATGQKRVHGTFTATAN